VEKLGVLGQEPLEVVEAPRRPAAGLLQAVLDEVLTGGRGGPPGSTDGGRAPAGRLQDLGPDPGGDGDLVVEGALQPVDPRVQVGGFAAGRVVQPGPASDPNVWVAWSRAPVICRWAAASTSANSSSARET
jgi:hypothetical protein